MVVADGGSTKCEWVVLHADGREIHAETTGVNPVQATAQMIETEWAGLGTRLEIEGPTDIYYYGAGCLPGNPSETMRDALRHLTGADNVTVESDMLGAARGLLGHESGVACILGTGANSCLFDGERIVSNVRPLGFILGDEGSGADIGKHIVADALKGLWPTELTERFWAFAGTDYATIIARIYRETRPSAYLASFARFAAENIENEHVQRIVTERLSAFIRRNVMQYPHEMVLRGVCFVGGVAKRFEAELAKACASAGVPLGRIEERPLRGMLDYHSC